MIDEERISDFISETVKNLSYKEIFDGAFKYSFEEDISNCVWKELKEFAKKDPDKLTEGYFITGGFAAGIQYALENFPTYNEEAAGEQEERSENDT